MAVPSCPYHRCVGLCSGYPVVVFRLF